MFSKNLIVIFIILNFILFISCELVDIAYENHGLPDMHAIKSDRMANSDDFFPDIANYKHGYPDMVVPQSRATIQTDTFTVRYDHFNFFRRSLFNMRYFYNDEFYNSTNFGPMFVFIGGENPIDSIQPYLQAGLMYEMAKEMGAYMFMVEHRFYGQSVPDGTLKVSNMDTLAINQVLADLIDFINNRRNAIPSLQNSKVVVFGGSYAANLATWLRLKYPQIVDAAVASSGPVKAQVDFFEYIPIMQDSLNNTQCNDVITNATKEIQNKLKTNSGLNDLYTDLNLCAPLKWNDKQEVRNLFQMIIRVFSQSVEYGTPSSIKSVCDTLLSLPYDTSYLKLTNFIKNSVPACLPSYATSIGQLKSTDMLNTNRAWTYQKCSQLGYFQTTESKYQQPFGDTVPLSYYQQMCSDIFGMFFSSMRTYLGVWRTNNVYGGLNPLVTHVISTQGSLDPWHALGFARDLSPLSPTIIIDGASHCQDLLAEDPQDPQSLKDARQRIKQTVAKWIAF